MALGLQTEMLPRLLYVGDVPVESSYHGSALLYRLLQDYPADRLMVLEAKPHISLPERRLPDVQYRRLPTGLTRLRYTRLSRLESNLQILISSVNTIQLRRLCYEFKPEAVLTVAQGYSWLSAARFAKKAELPLHLIVHDDWPTVVSVFLCLKRSVDRQFGRVYRQAASRLCVSPYMEEEYRKRYGVSGEVLFPLRAKNCTLLNHAPRTYSKEGGPLIGAYAGNMSCAGYARLIAKLASRLEARKGLLLLYGPHSPESLAGYKLNKQNILIRGLLESEELISRLRDEADFVFVPMTFDNGDDRQNMRLSFPSKLTDYTATGLPLLIWGPAYSSAVRWAQRHAPVSEVVTTEEVSEIDAAVTRLESAERRKQLGQSAMHAGNLLFSHDICVQTLYAALRSGRAIEVSL